MLTRNATRFDPLTRSTWRAMVSRMATSNAGSDALRRAMKKRGHRNSDVARLCGVTESAVRDWLSGHRRPSPGPLGSQERLELAYEIPPVRWYETAERQVGTAA